MALETALPEEWTADKRSLREHGCTTHYSPPRPLSPLSWKDATAEQLQEIYDRVKALIWEAARTDHSST